MKKIAYESALQDYLTKNNGFNLKKIDSDLELIESEHIFRGGRIDILAKKNSKLIGLELKCSNYQTRGICAQLLNYLNYLSNHDGEVYFIAPKIKYGIYSTLSEFYINKKLKLFEVTRIGKKYLFEEIKPANIKDSRHVDFQAYGNENLPDTLYDEKIARGISILVKDKKKARLINNIIDDRKSKQKQFEDITDSIVDILATKKNNILRTAYELLKLL